MSDLSKRIANLPPEKRELLMRQLSQRGVGATSASIPVRPRNTPAFPLSFAQQRLWFLDQLEPGGSAYNLSAAVRIRGMLDVAALERSFQELVRRHEALRTTFQAGEDGPVQRIAATARLGNFASMYLRMRTCALIRC